MKTVAVTGAWSYSGRAIARESLASGYRVTSLSNRGIPDPDPHGGRVSRIPYGSFHGEVLARALEGVDVLYCGYWTRHDRAPVEHRGPWVSHARAAAHSEVLIAAAKKAGVGRLVWTSIANPGLDPDLSYYAGKARVEESVRESGLPYAILRPACLFGSGGILIENVAWAVRRMPFVPIPSGPAYRIRPIHVDDYARVVVGAIESDEVLIRDAVGPERPEFGELVRDAGSILTGRPGRVARMPLPACRALYAAASRAMRETVLTADELKGLSRNRLDSTAAPAGTTRLSEWMRENVDRIGRRFMREPRRTGGG